VNSALISNLAEFSAKKSKNQGSKCDGCLAE